MADSSYGATITVVTDEINDDRIRQLQIAITSI